MGQQRSRLQGRARARSVQTRCATPSIGWREEAADINIERLCDAVEHQHACVALTAFDAAQISLVNARLVSQLLLGESACSAQSPDIPAHSASGVHVLMAAMTLAKAIDYKS